MGDQRLLSLLLLYERPSTRAFIFRRILREKAGAEEYLIFRKIRYDELRSEAVTRPSFLLAIIPSSLRPCAAAPCSSFLHSASLRQRNASHPPLPHSALSFLPSFLFCFSAPAFLLFRCFFLAFSDLLTAFECRSKPSFSAPPRCSSVLLPACLRAAGKTDA